jgi:hypothetical protein
MDQETKDYLTFIVEPAVRQHCGPIFFSTSETTPLGNILANGSFGLVNTGSMRLLVTCNHVWDDFKALRAQNPKTMFTLCVDKHNPIIIPDPDALLVDSDKRCDLATFDTKPISDAFVAGSLEFYDGRANRPPKLHEGDTLYMIGFPGKHRQDNATSIGFVRQPIGVAATQVGNSSFFADVSKFSLKADDYGGISGCPCFLVLKDRPVRLVGFATGYAPNNIAMLQFTYARYIRPDGFIQYMF